MSSVTRYAIKLRLYLNHPQKVFFLCLSIFIFSVLLNGTLIRLWGLHRDHAGILREIDLTQKSISSLEAQLIEAKDPAFIERQARDKLDLAGEHDLVFVFSNN